MLCLTFSDYDWDPGYSYWPLVQTYFIAINNSNEVASQVLATLVTTLTLASSGNDRDPIFICWYCFERQ